MDTKCTHGNIYFSGLYSGWATNGIDIVSGWGQVNAGIVNYDVNVSESDVYCNALYACTGLFLQNGNNLFVVGARFVPNFIFFMLRISTFCFVHNQANGF